MPSPAKTSSKSSAKQRICVFGDSQIGCIKHALDEGLFKPISGTEFEFWGADGPRFRELDLVEGEIIPRTSVQETVLMVNGNGRETLSPDDFDVILFKGVRVRSSDFFVDHLPRLQGSGGYLSSAVLARCVVEWLDNNRFYAAAKDFAAQGKAKIALHPATFMGEGMAGQPPKGNEDALNASPLDRAALWDLIDAKCTADGITLIRQPEETVVSGVLTAADFNRVNVDGSIDYKHRSAAYGALILSELTKAKLKKAA